MDVLPRLTMPCVITHVVWDGPVDDYGNPTATTTTTTLDGAPGCWIVQTKRDDATALTNRQEETFDGYFPPGTALAGTDRVEVTDAVFEIVGPPWNAFDPLDGRVDFVEATLVRVE